MGGLSLSVISFHAPLTSMINHNYKEKELDKKYKEKFNDKVNVQLSCTTSSILYRTLSSSSSIKYDEKNIISKFSSTLPGPLLSSQSSSILFRPKSTQNILESHPRSYQSKQLLQKKNEDKVYLSLLALQSLNKFNSNMIHSCVGEIMPVTNEKEIKSINYKNGKKIKSEYETENENRIENENANEILESFEIPMKPYIKRQNELKAINDSNNLKFRRMERMISTVDSNNFNHKKKKFKFFPEKKSDPLIKKKSKLLDIDFTIPSSSQEHSFEISLQSSEILSKTSHLLRQ